MAVGQSRRNNLWFGTEERMAFFPTPNRGANTGASGWESGGSTINGGGYQLNSFGSARNYLFEWPSSSTRQVAQIMKSYADGSYGRGLIYFLDPLTYTTNVFPAMWADPSMGVGIEGASLVYGLDPIGVPTSNAAVNDLPRTSAYFDLGSVTVNWRGKEEAVFIPIPAGHTLHLGSIHAQTGSGRVFYRTQSVSGGLGSITELSPLLPDSTTLVNATETSANLGVWVWVGRNANSAGSVTLTAMTARITEDARPNPFIGEGPWIGGQGHSGCRFIGKPTEVKNTGVGGGQVGFAASFREVGSWLYG